MPSIAAIVVAGGSGTRAGAAAGVPKQYALVSGRPAIAQVVAALRSAVPTIAIVCVIREADRGLYERAFCPDVPPPWVIGGTTRQISVLNGLRVASASNPHRVVIHDAARPFAEPRLYLRVLEALDEADGAIAALPVADTLKRATVEGMIAGTADRTGLWRAQTPQAFRFAPLLAAHEKASAAGRTDFTDDASVLEWAGLPVRLVVGSENNVKITTADDLAAAQRTYDRPAFEFRTGQGFDVHAFAAGHAVWLCGVEIPHSHRLDGHSDADVALHAITDALLGAIGDGDIGQHFPPSDPQWKGAASATFLADAGRRVAERGGKITSVDVTVLCEAPRIGPYRDAMRARIAEILGIDAGRVGVKATTTEGLGFVGRREGIAAMATATVLLPA